MINFDNETQVLILLRKEMKLSQAAVASDLQTTASALARWESGGGKNRHSISVRNLKRWAAVLGCQVEITFVPLADIK